MKLWKIFTYATMGILILTGTTHAAFFDFLFQKPQNAVQLIQIIGDMADIQQDFDGRLSELEKLTIVGASRLGAGSTIETIEQFRASTSPYSAIATRIHAKNIYVPFSHATTSALTATNIYGTGSSTINVLNVNTCNGCPGSGSVTGSGSANRLAYWDSGSSISSDADFTINAATGNLTATYASSTFITTTYATTTALSVSGSFAVTPLTSALTLTGADGTFAEYTGTSCTNQFPRSLSALGAATCASVSLTLDVTGVLPDANVADDITLTNITQITNRDITSLTTTAGAGAVYFSSGAVPAVDATNLIFNDALNRLTYTYGTTTFLTATYASSTALTAGNLFSTNASSTYFSTSQNIIAGNTLIVPGLTSAITLTGAAGIFAEYAGTSCTNQFVRSLDALGVATCATVVAGDVDLADLTATNATLTFSGTYDGSTARTIGLNLASSNEWTASTTFSGVLNVEALSLTASGTISTLNVNTGNFGSTTHQRLNMNSCGGDGCGELFSFTIASSSSLFGTSIPLPTKEYAYTVTRISCYVTAGTSKVVTVTDGTNAMDSLTCATTKTNDDGAIANNTATAGELMKVTMGTGVGAVDAVSVTIFGVRGQ